MNAGSLGRTLLAVSLAAMWSSHSRAEDCSSAGSVTVASSSDYAHAPTTKKAVTLPVTGVAYSQTPKTAAEAVDKILEDDYRPRYKDVQPGASMQALDAQLAEEKSQFRRSRIDFGSTATGIDATPLRGEFTYKNKEAMLTLARKGTNTYFFFIQERLWKVIQEPPLGTSSSLGSTYQDAVVKMGTNLGVMGRVLAPDATSRMALELDWKDATTHLRAIQRGNAAIALAYEDISTLANLGTLRPNKPATTAALDPAVAAAFRNPSPCPKPKGGK